MRTRVEEPHSAQHSRRLVREFSPRQALSNFVIPRSEASRNLLFACAGKKGYRLPHPCRAFCDRVGTLVFGGDTPAGCPTSRALFAREVGILTVEFTEILFGVAPVAPPLSRFLRQGGDFDFWWRHSRRVPHFSRALCARSGDFDRRVTEILFGVAPVAPPLSRF